TLPLTLFFAAAIDADFVHYSSEHVSLALIAVAAWGLLRMPTPQDRSKIFVFGGFVAGTLPWAKLQTVPIAAALVCIGLWRIFLDPPLPFRTRSRLAAKLVLAACLPSLLAVLVAAASGQIENLYRDYVLQNFSYVNQNWSFDSAIREMGKFSLNSGNLPAFGVTSLVVIGLAATLGKSVLKPRYVAAGILTCIAVFCVIVPKRPSLHYTLLLVLPLGIWSAISIGELWQLQERAPRWRLWTAGISIAAMVIILAVRLGSGTPSMFGRFSDHWRRPRSAAGTIVRALTGPTDRLAVWGWLDRVYVEAGLAQATHESESFEQLSPSRQQEHYQARYLSDLERNRPAVFVDGTGPGAHYFTDRAKAGHETVPRVAAFIQKNYKLLTDLGYARIYVTPERLASRSISDDRLWQMIASSRRDPDGSAPVSLTPRRLIRKKLYGRTMQMMLPPAEMVWSLAGNEREVFLEYGFDPKAYTKGQSNGAELIVELSSPGAPPLPLFRRMLDPNKRVDDRGNLVSNIVLPPFRAGSRLIVRTTPGEFGDNAWDWIYVGAFDWVRSPTYSPNQFPGYARVPASIVSEHISILENAEGKLLMSHAPAVMRFPLRGNERSWEFDFGFQPGAYTGSERTDGATFVVQLERFTGSTSLFSKKLDPANITDDQGRQHEKVTLPELQPGDELVMRIDPNGNLAWDWTYITNLKVESSSGGR
ncbi:MAG: hypothetical protein ABIO94_08505, partial [Opitutaceae bacterium]